MKAYKGRGVVILKAYKGRGVVIMKAYKGRGVVIMNTDKYHKECRELLHMEQFQKKSWSNKNTREESIKCFA